MAERDVPFFPNRLQFENDVGSHISGGASRQKVGGTGTLGGPGAEPPEKFFRTTPFFFLGTPFPLLGNAPFSPRKQSLIYFLV